MAKEKDFYIKFSLNSLRHRKLRSWLTMIGIFIGIAGVVSLIGLGEGLRYAINSQFGFLGTDILAVTASGGLGPPGTGVVKPLTDKELNEIKNIPGIEGAAGRIMKSAKIKFNKKATFSYAVSMPDGEDRKVIEDAINIKAEKGRLLQDGDKGYIVMGYSFSREDNEFKKPILPGSKVEIQGKEFKVIGIMEKKGNFQVDAALLMNEDDLRELIGVPEKEYDVFAVKFDENTDVNKIKLDIEKSLRKARNVKEGEEDFSVQTPASILAQVNSIILGVQIFIYIIAAISILVGGIGIMNTMYTAVVERTRDIGIMKAIGAENSAIFNLFFIESGLLGTVGGIIGTVLGISFASALAFAGRLALGSDLISAKFSLGLIVGSILGSFVIGSFFGTLPAVRASKLNPVDAIRRAK